MNNTTNAVFIPTIIAQKSLGRFASYMNLAKTVARNFDLTPATEGQVIQVPKRGTLSANQKTLGTDVTVQKPTATNVSVTLDQHWEVTFGIEDVTKVLENQNSMDGYAEDAAIALAEKVESKLAGLHPSITNTVTFNTTSDDTMEDSFLKVRERLVLNKVPKTEKMYAYLHPTVITKLLGVDKFSRADALGRAGVIEEGAILKLGGINVFEGQLIEGTGSPVAWHNLVYTRNAMVLAARPLPGVPAGFGAMSEVVVDPDINLGLRVVSSYDADALGMQITLDVLFGVAILDDRLIVELESF